MVAVQSFSIVLCKHLAGCALRVHYYHQAMISSFCAVHISKRTNVSTFQRLEQLHVVLYPSRQEPRPGALRKKMNWPKRENKVQSGVVCYGMHIKEHTSDTLA